MSEPVTDTTTIDPRLRAFTILNRVAEHRSTVYRWLAIGFYPPDSELAAALCSGQVASDLRTATAWLGEDQALLLPHLNAIGDLRHVTLTGLEQSYEALFGKNVHRISLRESTYCWRAASTVLDTARDITCALQQQYAQFGVSAISGQEDHIAVELELLAYLCQSEARSWAANASETARQTRRQQRNFLDDHLGRWLPDVCWRIATCQPISFYTYHAQLSDAWLQLEHGSNYMAANKSC